MSTNHRIKSKFYLHFSKVQLQLAKGLFKYKGLSLASTID